MCVAAYGADEFPAFFTRSSGRTADCRVDTPADAARLVRAALALRLGGLVIGAFRDRVEVLIWLVSRNAQVLPAQLADVSIYDGYG